VPEWQLLQSVFAGCGSGGGAPWQPLQGVGPADTTVHVGAVFKPPAPSVAPWQYVEPQVVRSRPGRALKAGP
jgi:hypothetical protein